MHNFILLLEERRAREEEEERERQERERIEREEAARKKAKKHQLSPKRLYTGTLQALQDARIAEESLKVKALQTEWNENLATWKNEQAAKKEVSFCIKYQSPKPLVPPPSGITTYRAASYHW